MYFQGTQDLSKNHFGTYGRTYVYRTHSSHLSKDYVSMILIAEIKLIQQIWL